jgi:hypothetical protein
MKPMKHYIVYYRKKSIVSILEFTDDRYGEYLDTEAKELDRINSWNNSGKDYVDNGKFKFDRFQTHSEVINA